MHRLGYFLQHTIFTSQLKQLYWFFGFAAFATSMVGLFIPMYLYIEIGYSLTVTILFFIVENIFFAIATPFAASFLLKHGAKHTILVAIPFKCITIMLLYMLAQNPLLLFFVAIMSGCYQGFLWLGIHLLFKHVTQKKRRGAALGARMSIGSIAATAGPIVGGLCIEFFGFYALFLLFITLTAISSACLFLNGDYTPKYRYNPRHIFRKVNGRYALFFISQGMIQMGHGFIWPFIMFFILQSYLSLGVAGALFTAISAIIIYLSGKRSDKTNKRTMIRRLLPFELFSWIFRGLAHSAGQVYAALSIGGVTTGLLAPPIGALEYDNASSHPMYYFIQREFFIVVGRILLLLFLLISGHFAGSLFIIAFAQLAILLF